MAVGLGRGPLRVALLREAGFDVRYHDLETPFGVAAIEVLRGTSDIVHCAALSSPYGPARAFAAANVDATRHVLALGQTLGVKRFNHISSASVRFTPTDQPEVREDVPLPAPFNANARTKAQAERLVLAAYELCPVVLRPHGIYGAGDPALVPRLLRAVRSVPLLRDGRARIDLTHFDDVVAAILAAMGAGDAFRGRSSTSRAERSCRSQKLPQRLVRRSVWSCARARCNWGDLWRRRGLSRRSALGCPERQSLRSPAMGWRCSLTPKALI